jgi:hypothetical protein
MPVASAGTMGDVIGPMRKGTEVLPEASARLAVTLSTTAALVGVVHVRPPPTFAASVALPEDTAETGSADVEVESPRSTTFWLAVLTSCAQN